MFIFSWITILIATLACAEPARLLQIAPAKEFFPFNQEPGKTSSCVVSLPKPAVVKVLSETTTEFEVEWKVEPTGCYWQQLWGQSLKRGFIRKSDIIWQEDLKEPLPMIAFTQRFPDTAPRAVECLDPVSQKFVPDAVKEMGITELINFMRAQAGGIKPPKMIDQYQRCYPYKNSATNYQKYKKFIAFTGDIFRLTDKKVSQEVNPSLLGCLFRRESGFDENTTGASGIGQHTAVNIKEISNRLTKSGSWELALWKKFFEKVKADPEGRAMLAACKGSALGNEPVFNTKEDAKCPLQSIAAGSIYILMIQRELQKNSKVAAIQWENELEYQTAIAAAYNLGDGAAGLAVKDLLVNDWVGAIRKRSTKAAYGKDCEVSLHINAVRNCLQSNNPWQPMHPNDKPVCAELKSANIKVLPMGVCDTGLNRPKAAPAPPQPKNKK